MSMAPEDIAGLLAEAARTRRPIPPIRDLLQEESVDAAYAVQEAFTRRSLDQGRRIVGRKIGLTSPAVQAQLGVSEPDFGMLYADMEVADGTTIDLQTLIQPKIELEMAFVLRRPLDRADVGIGEVHAAIDWVVPVFEVVDSRIADWKISFHDTVADNASSGLYVLGHAAKRIDEVDLRLAGAVVEQNGEPVSVGAAAACLGSPLNAVQWLARTMARRGRPLQAGEIVLSGALGPMTAVSGAQRFEGRINGLGSVSIAFEENRA